MLDLGLRLKAKIFGLGLGLSLVACVLVNITEDTTVSQLLTAECDQHLCLCLVQIQMLLSKQ